MQNDQIGHLYRWGVEDEGAITIVEAAKVLSFVMLFHELSASLVFLS
jgi:hypothetical protein